MNQYLKYFIRAGFEKIVRGGGLKVFRASFEIFRKEDQFCS